MKTNIRAYLNLAHDDANFIKFNKGILQSLFQKHNITNFNFSVTRVDSGIELFNTGEIESLYAENIITIIKDKINENKKMIEELISTFNFSVIRIEVVIKVFNNEMPSIFLDQKTIQFLNSFNLEIDFDNYIFDVAPR